MMAGGSAASKSRQGHVLPFDHVISTMPLTLLVKGLADMPAGRPDARPTASHFATRSWSTFMSTASDLFPDQWLYVHSPELLTGRVTNFRNWVPELHGESPNSILALEYWCNDDDALVDGERCRADRASARPKFGRRASLVRRGCWMGMSSACGAAIRSMPGATNSRCGRSRRYLDTIEGLMPIGRYGAFKYNNQDHSILMGLLAAENISEGTEHNLWDINTDYESLPGVGADRRGGTRVRRVGVTRRSMAHAVIRSTRCNRPGVRFSARRRATFSRSRDCGPLVAVVRSGCSTALR